MKTPFRDPPTVADTLSGASFGVYDDYTLNDGARVAVVGGGPAGSFFSYFVRRMADEIGLDVAVDLYEPRKLSYCGPAGCNHCGGVVSESMVQILAAEGINLPAGVVQRGIESYQIHMDVGSVAIESPAHEMRIATLFRGNGPREGGVAPNGSFDDHLQGLAVEQGVRVVRRLITGLRWDDTYPLLQFAGRPEERYDLVAVATGVNSNFLEQLEDEPVGYPKPKNTRTYICEFRLGEDGVREHLGNAVHVFLLTIPRLEFSAVVPKGEYATVIMVGEDLDQELVHAFLRDPVVQRVLPTETAPCVCSCTPLLNMGVRKRPYGDRIVMIGDSGVTRLYKDGIGAAFRTAKAAAGTAVFEGTSAKAFEEHYWPACKAIVNDNAIGAFMFGASGALRLSRYLRGVVARMVLREQDGRGRVPHMSSLLWNMFTGSAPYREILRGALHPGFIGNLALNLPGSSRRLNKGKSSHEETLHAR